LTTASLQTTAANSPTALQTTPFSTGYSTHERTYSIGDEYQFEVIDQFNASRRQVVRRVTKVDYDGDRIEYNNGRVVTDIMGNILVNEGRINESVRQFYPADFFIGKKWTTRFTQKRATIPTQTFDYKLRVVGRESITVPAGTFDTFKVEAKGFNVESGHYIERTIWVAPGINADIAQTYKVVLRNGELEANQREELKSYVVAKSSTQK
jgi:hypothetical protein